MRKKTEPLKRPEEPICDFCRSPEIGGSYNALPFIVTTRDTGQVVFGSDDTWLVCRVCRSMIEHENWDGVVNRAVESFCRDFPDECQTPEAIRGVRMTIRIAVTAFREGRQQAA